MQPCCIFSLRRIYRPSVKRRESKNRLMSPVTSGSVGHQPRMFKIILVLFVSFVQLSAGRDEMFEQLFLCKQDMHACLALATEMPIRDFQIPISQRYIIKVKGDQKHQSNYQSRVCDSIRISSRWLFH